MTATSTAAVRSIRRHLDQARPEAEVLGNLAKIEETIREGKASGATVAEVAPELERMLQALFVEVVGLLNVAAHSGRSKSYLRYVKGEGG
jgi:hypothetical protein